MKKIFLIAIPVLALSAACAKTEVKPVQTDPQQISYLPLASRTATRTLIDGTTYPVTETFGTFAYFNAQGTTFPADAEVYIPGSEVKNTTGATTGTAWTTDPAYYWPKQGSLTFFSYSPYSIAAAVNCDTTYGINITDWNVDANQTVDVLVADVKTGQTKNGTNAGYEGVPTIFRHKLSQIVKFTFATKDDYCGGRAEADAQVGDKFFYINSVKINNINYKGTYVGTTNLSATSLGLWNVTDLTDTKDYTWYEDTTTGTAFGYDTKKADAPCGNANGYILILPQTFTAPDRTADGYEANEKNIQISYTIKTCTAAADATAGAEVKFSTEEVKDVYVTLYDVQYDTASATLTNWEMNKKISYTITIGLDQIYWAPSVEDWAEQSFAYTVEH